MLLDRLKSGNTCYAAADISCSEEGTSAYDRGELRSLRVLSVVWSSFERFQLRPDRTGSCHYLSLSEIMKVFHSIEMRAQNYIH
jgi:hypothetical protein